MSRDPMDPLDDKSFGSGSTASDMDAGDVKARLSEAATKTKAKATQMVDAVSEKLDQKRETAADGLDRVASTLHGQANKAPGGPKVINFTHTLADGMESTATYLRDHDLSKMGKDLMDVCRKHPTQSVVAALALGFLIGRSARR
jgi:hypothetical protein